MIATLFIGALFTLAGADQIIEPQNYGPPAFYPDSAKDRLYKLPWTAGKTFAALDGYWPEPGHSHHPEYSIDFDLPLNEPLLAARAGVVGRIVNNETICNVGYEGNTVEIFHENDSMRDSTQPGGWRKVRVRDRYYHLSKNPPVTMGQVIQQGQLIGYANCTGIDGGTPHLHFRVHVDSVRGVWRHLGWHTDDNRPSYFFASIPTPFLEVTQHANGLAEEGDILTSQNTPVSAENGGLSCGTAVPLRASPNPFKANVRIRFFLEQDSRIDLALFDMSGKRVAGLARGFYQANTEHGFDWDGAGFPAGYYVVRLNTGHGSHTVRVMLLK